MDLRRSSSRSAAARDVRRGHAAGATLALLLLILAPGAAAQDSDPFDQAPDPFAPGGPADQDPTASLDEQAQRTQNVTLDQEAMDLLLSQPGGQEEAPDGEPDPGPPGDDERSTPVIGPLLGLLTVAGAALFHKHRRVGP